MNLQQFRNKILHNWPYKLACLGLAIVVYMLHRSIELEKKNFTIPVQVIENGAVMSIDSKINNVTITVRSDAETISTIHPSDFKASINLNNFSKSGEYLVPIDVEIKNELYDIATFEIKQKPQTVKVHVEKKEVGYIPLEPVFVGDAAYGYEIANTTIEPKFIEVIGPESIIQNTKSIKTEKILIQDKTTTFTSDVGIRNPNSIIQIVDKGPFTVKVEMDTIKIDRAFERKPIDFRNLPSHLQLKGNYPEVTVTLNGSLISLENYELPAFSIWIDLSLITEEGSYELPLQFAIPSYYKMVASSVEKINVTVEAKKEEISENSQSELTEENGNTETEKEQKTE